MSYKKAMKLSLIGMLMNEEDDLVLKQVGEVLADSPNRKRENKLSDFKNRLTDEELDQFEKNIEEGCGQIPTHGTQKT